MLENIKKRRAKRDGDDAEEYGDRKLLSESRRSSWTHSVPSPELKIQLLPNSTFSFTLYKIEFQDLQESCCCCIDCATHHVFNRRTHQSPALKHQIPPGIHGMDLQFSSIHLPKSTKSTTLCTSTNSSFPNLND